jgi:shikimate kinase
MGTGKSSVGRLVAHHLRFSFIDTDALIEQRAGRSVAAIFQDSGEPAFRALECAVVDELGHVSGRVIATGGGLGADPENLRKLKQHALVVCLWARPETIWRRVQHQNHRPLLREPDPQGRIRALLAARREAYLQADVLISTDPRDLREVARQVAQQFRLARSSADETRDPQ